MRVHAMMAAGLLLAACSGEQASTETDDFVTANGTPAGVYEVSAADGTASIVTINADGTYSQVTPDGSNAARGTLEVVGEQTCFRVHSPGAVALCYSESAPAADGSYTASTDDGLVLTVRPYVAPEEGDAETEGPSEENA